MERHLALGGETADEQLIEPAHGVPIEMAQVVARHVSAVGFDFDARGLRMAWKATLAGTLALGLVSALAIGGCAAPAATTAPAPTASSPAEPTPALTPVEPTLEAGESLTIVARNIQFQPERLSMAAGQAVILTFRNADDGIPHLLHVSGPAGDALVSEVITGPATVDLPLGPLGAGVYSFVCDVHPNMTSSLTIGG